MSFRLELRELEQLTQQLSTTSLRSPSCDKDIKGGEGAKGALLCSSGRWPGVDEDAQPPASGYGLP